MLQHLSISKQPGGKIIKTYRISEPFTAVHCLSAINSNADVIISHGERKASHDVGCGSSADYDEYHSVRQFVDSGDYNTYAGDDYVSRYSFSGTYQGRKIRIDFADKGILTLLCDDDVIDLCAIMDEAEEAPYQRKRIAVLCGSYSEETVFYDARSKEFFIHESHCSSIDDAEWFDDGETCATNIEVVKRMLDYGKLSCIQENQALLGIDDEKLEAILQAREQRRKERIAESHKKEPKSSLFRWLRRK